MKVDRNLIAGMTNSLWSAGVGIAVVPLYLRYLGMESYGLIAFFTSAQALLSLLDMGLAPTMNREVARCSATGNFDDARRLLHTVSVASWSVALLLGIAMAALAPAIARYWLNANSLPEARLRNALFLMAAVFACRWPIGIYQGAVIGAQRLVVTSAINIVMVTLSSLGAVLLLATVSPRIETFFEWQAAVGIAYALAMRTAAWRVLGNPRSEKFSLDVLRGVWRFSAGMSGVAVSGTILMQLDKVLLSRLLTLSAFGAYSLAATISGGLYVLLSPTFNVIYPRLSAMVASNDTARLIIYYRNGTRMLSACLFPAACFISCYAIELLKLWTRDPSIAAHAAPIVSVFIIGTALNGAMHFPFALQLAYGATRIPLTINGVLLLFTVPSTILLAFHFGAIGGATSWALVNLLYLVVGTWLTHRSLLPGIGLQWASVDVGIPLTISALVVFGTGFLAHLCTDSTVVLLGIGCISALTSAGLVMVVSGMGRSTLARLAHGKLAQTTHI